MENDVACRETEDGQEEPPIPENLDDQQPRELSSNHVPEMQDNVVQIEDLELPPPAEEVQNEEAANQSTNPANLDDDDATSNDPPAAVATEVTVINAENPDQTPESAVVTDQQPEEDEYDAVQYLAPRPGSGKWINKYNFIGKFELILGIYFLLFGISAIIVTSNQYDGKYVEIYGGVTGLGVLLIVAAAMKLCRAYYKSGKPVNMIFSILGFLGAGAVAGAGIWFILKDQLGKTNQMIPAVIAVTAVTALLCLIHVVIYIKGRKVLLKPIPAILYTNLRTGQYFSRALPVETKESKKEIKRSQSMQNGKLDSQLSECAQPPPDYHSHMHVQTTNLSRSVSLMAIQNRNAEKPAYRSQAQMEMTNLTRSVSMRTVQNQYAEKPNHELPQYNTVYKHPVTTMQQHREQQKFLEQQYAQKDMIRPRAATELEYPINRPGTSLSGAQPQPAIAYTNGGYTQARSEVDLRVQLPSMVPQENHNSTLRYSPASSEMSYNSNMRGMTHEYARSETGYSASNAGVAYPVAPRTVQSQPFVQRDRPSAPHMNQVQRHVHYQMDVQTNPMRQYNQPQDNQRMPQPILDQAYMERNMAYPHGAMSEANFSRAASDEYNPYPQGGRISPRLALAQRQMIMQQQQQIHQVARHQSFQGVRSQPMYRNQPYIVTRQPPY